MQLYLTGAPLTTKKNGWSAIAKDLRAETERLALIKRANTLHQQSPTGLSIKAAGLKVRGTVSHLRRAKGEHYLLLYWVTLSDGSKHRASWLRQTAELGLLERWDRIPWSNLVFSLRGPHKAATQHRKHA
jgi:hypothetical protein